MFQIILYPRPAQEHLEHIASLRTSYAMSFVEHVLLGTLSRDVLNSVCMCYVVCNNTVLRFANVLNTQKETHGTRNHRVTFARCISMYDLLLLTQEGKSLSNDTLISDPIFQTRCV